jgi:histone deacetylase complex regulatory component SIN3
VYVHTCTVCTRKHYVDVCCPCYHPVYCIHTRLCLLVCVYQVEDERFEVDMVIDANMCTIRVLEPLAEEIATMKAVEAMPRGPGACVT